jgi:hypothetical protein
LEVYEERRKLRLDLMVIKRMAFVGCPPAKGIGAPSEAIQAEGNALLEFAQVRKPTHRIIPLTEAYL